MIVREVGRYPADAFTFIQECLAAAAENVHGAMSADESTVAHWMGRHDVDLGELQRRQQQSELPPDIASALERIGGTDRMNRHVTGQQVCRAVRDVALKRWGLMAQSVLARWSITRTEDIGAIIFALVDNDWLQKQPTDSAEDFNAVFSFDEVFNETYRIGTGEP